MIPRTIMYNYLRLTLLLDWCWWSFDFSERMSIPTEKLGHLHRPQGLGQGARPGDRCPGNLPPAGPRHPGGHLLAGPAAAAGQFWPPDAGQLAEAGWAQSDEYSHGGHCSRGEGVVHPHQDRRGRSTQQDWRVESGKLKKVLLIYDLLTIYKVRN